MYRLLGMCHSIVSGVASYTRVNAATPILLPPASPISEMPVDVLLEIFSASILSAGSDPTLPMILSQVCRGWRNLLFRTPTLWANITVFEKVAKTNDSVEQTLSRVQTFLWRSRQCPLNIDLTFLTWEGYECDETLDGPKLQDNYQSYLDVLGYIGNALVPHADRIRVFTLTVDDYESTGEILGEFRSVKTMPLLQYWRVNNKHEHEVFRTPDDLEDSDDEPYTHHALLHLEPLPAGDKAVYSPYPNLHSLTLHSAPVRWTQFCNPRALKELTISLLPLGYRPTALDLYNILSACAPCLESLCLKGSITEDAWPAALTLPNLQSLELGFCEAVELIPFITGVAFPALLNFTLTDIRREFIDLDGRLKVDTEFDAGIAPLLNTISRRFPMESLWKITLRHILLYPTEGVIHTMRDPDADAALTFAVCFFSTLKGPHYIILVDPDDAMLGALNRVHPFTPAHGNLRTDSDIPTPHLRLLHVERCAASILNKFVRYRAQYPDLVYPLFSLIIHQPESWFKSVGWGEPCSGGIDESALAAFQVFWSRTVLNSGVEHALLNS